MVYCGLLQTLNFDSARQSAIEALRSERETPSPCGKGDEEDRLRKVAASQNSKFEVGRSINSISLSRSVTVNDKPLLKKWEILICAITVIGLFILLGMYYKRKTEQIRAVDRIQFPTIPFIDPNPELLIEKETILSHNPNWIPIVSNWQNISLSDQVWVLQLYELLKFRVPIEPLSNPTLSINQPAQILAKRSEIENALAKIVRFECNGNETHYCPNAIYLLPNLERIWLPHNKITTMPDLGRFEKLTLLNLENNKLKIPPDLSKNLNLEWLNLSKNQLKMPPKLHHNKNLTYFWINKNQLTQAPDLSANVKLEILAMNNNQLTTAPNLSKNTLLRNLSIGNNKITEAPVIRNNLDLQLISMKTNPLSNEAKKKIRSLKRIHLGIMISY